ncbi:restriction endonuclease [Paenibacillus sp. GP183]|uniref:5-methylcytosine restriction system specificity protein McrC n=1 Tax=Paenibacillus sp. GP183 TaxID=1882751 RepID=UPI001495886E
MFPSPLKTSPFIRHSRCTYDELNCNNTHNQIIKSTISYILKTEGIERQLRENLFIAYRKFSFANQIVLSVDTFRRVSLNRNNRVYYFILSISEIIYRNLLPEESLGTYRFKDFTQDEREMSVLFENFVRNFYRQEQNIYKVKRENINWPFESLDDKSAGYLPQMQTDISLIGSTRKIIIDTKYYKETFRKNYGKETIHSSHLYQMFSYMSHVEITQDQNLEGILLYPSIKENVKLSYMFNGCRFSVRSINLYQDWKQIHKDLIELIECES